MVLRTKVNIEVLMESLDSSEIFSPIGSHEVRMHPNIKLCN